MARRGPSPPRGLYAARRAYAECGGGCQGLDGPARGALVAAEWAGGAEPLEDAAARCCLLLAARRSAAGRTWAERLRAGRLALEATVEAAKASVPRNTL